MAQKAVAWAWTRPKLDGLTKYVLVALATKADQKGVATARRDEIAELTGLSETTVWRHCHTLEDAGLIRPITYRSKDGPEIRRKYRLMIAGNIEEED